MEGIRVVWGVWDKCSKTERKGNGKGMDAFKQRLVRTCV